jgi:hypothetical protein
MTQFHVTGVMQANDTSDVFCQIVTTVTVLERGML